MASAMSLPRGAQQAVVPVLAHHKKKIISFLPFLGEWWCESGTTLSITLRW